MAAKFSFGAYLARYARHFGCERTKLIDHRVNGVFQLEDFPFHINRDLFRQIAGRDRSGDRGDVSHLAGQVAGHEINRIGQVLPRAGDAFHACLATKNSLGTHFARHTCYLRGEGAKLINHHVDRIFELKEFTFDIDSDFLRQIAVRYCRRYRRDIANLRRKIAGH